MGWECDLFDRHGKAPDQSRPLVQKLGILFFNGLREPNQAFVIGQGGDVARHDRWNRPDENGLGVWHRITSRRTRPCPNLIGESAFLTLGSCHSGRPGSRFPERRGGQKPVRRQGYPVLPDDTGGRPISSFASRGGFVIRCRMRTLGFAYSSVAQR